jgi:hypothetical protein
MDFKVTVKNYTGAVKTVEVKDMPNEEAARAEAVALTFGKVLEIERTDSEIDEPVEELPEVIVPTGERELKPGETEITITGYNNNPLAAFSNLDIGF